MASMYQDLQGKASTTTILLILLVISLWNFYPELHHFVDILTSFDSKSEIHQNSLKVTHSVQATESPEERQNPGISYLSNPIERNFTYTLNGHNGTISLVLFSGLNDYLSSIDRTIYYTYVASTERDFILKAINNPYQNNEIKQIAKKIQTLTTIPDDQVRIAVSLVQNIPYNYDYVNGIDPVADRYPYQVLFDNKGVCGEKSTLLAALLRELGYGSAIFTYVDENHAAVGIKCPNRFSHNGTGYCFIESTQPTIITDYRGEYVGAGKLTSKPIITVINEGLSFDSVAKEYYDSINLNNLLVNGPVLSQRQYAQWLSIVQEYGMQSI